MGADWIDRAVQANITEYTPEEQRKQSLMGWQQMFSKKEF